ncbi:nitrile hydratase subunit beta [Pandoraea pneumonica]|uniref:nitrile hydratase subunit beta n=1 Tax=Pandoraea pneumonica TaxID=2508299 RepID=UPI003CEA083C
MKLQHHIGGIENLGPINLDTRVFAEAWERRIFGIHTSMMAQSAHLAHAKTAYPIRDLETTFHSDWTWASLRTGAEGMQPFDYFKYRYYEKWLGGIAQFFIDAGYITEQELSEKTTLYRHQPDAALPERENVAIDDQISTYLRHGDSGHHITEHAARFKLGDSVRIADPDAVEHTRLPGYLRNKHGVVDFVYPGLFSYFVSTGVDGIGAPMTVYRIAFNPEDIWGKEPRETNTLLYADLYEAYVTQA